MKRVKIIGFNNKQISKDIECYIKLFHDKPIILMNLETSQFLTRENVMFYPEKNRQTRDIEYRRFFYGCHVAIADWIPFGEVQLLKCDIN